jgi:regulatory protein
MTRITALRPSGRDRIAVEVDGQEWRVLPLDAVARAGLSQGLELDRPRLRTLRRELRRSEALAVAARTLRRRDASAAELDTRLAQAGVAADARTEALAALTAAGLVDDERVARTGSEALARRGWGDAAIAFRLERLGIDATTAADAQARLEPEVARAIRIVAARGRSRRTASHLARKGFSEDAIEAAFAAPVADGDPEGYDTLSSSIIFPA